MVDPQPDLALTPAQADRLVARWLGDDASCTAIHRLTGGMVNSVFRLDVDRPPHRAVVKLHTPGSDGFAQEARALRHLRDETDCPVPRVHLHEDSAHTVPYAFLLLEHVPGVCLAELDLTPDERADVDRQLAGLLAGLHTRTATRWGGITTAQRTAPWAEVFTERLHEVRGRPAVATRLRPEVLALVDRAIARAPGLLQDPGVPTLVHGDVWDGNVMVRREDGRWRVTGLLDPASEFADVELELAYLEVFDNPRDELRAAYERHHDPRPGHERRRRVYWLHTALVHVALFEERFFRDFTERVAAEIVRRG